MVEEKKNPNYLFKMVICLRHFGKITPFYDRNEEFPICLQASKRRNARSAINTTQAVRRSVVDVKCGATAKAAASKRRNARSAINTTQAVRRSVVDEDAPDRLRRMMVRGRISPIC